MATGYVSNWGNDNNDGLTWETAKRSIQGAKDAGRSPVNIEGQFNELVFVDTIGYNHAVLDLQFISQFAATGVKLTNCYIKNATEWQAIGDITNCICVNNKPFFQRGLISNSIFSNTAVTYSTDAGKIVDYNTIFKSGINVLFVEGIQSNNIYGDLALAFRNSYQTYSLFINVQFLFTGGGLGSDETVYTYPTGATDTDKLQNLRDRMVIVYGGLAVDYLIGCKYYSDSYNDIFVDADNGDFSLVPNCIAAHMSFNGDYVGAKPEGIKANWNTDFTNITNIGTPGFILDQNIDAITESNIIDIGHVRTILNFQALGNIATRNGQQINTESNLGLNIMPGSSVLTDGLIYQCVDDVITLNDGAGTSRIPWETFVAIDEGGGVGLGFSTGGSGSVKEVYTDERHSQKIQLKTSKTDATLTSATLITSFLYSNPIMVNVDGNGEPTHGDADVGYVEGTAVPLTSRYIKFYIKIKAWNLPARV